MLLVDTSVWVDYFNDHRSHGYRLLSKDGDFRKIARNTPLRLVELA